MAKAKKYLWNGEERTLNAICREVGLNQSTIWVRLKRGKSLEEALSQPIRGYGVGPKKPDTKKPGPLRRPVPGWVKCLGPLHGDKVVEFWSPDRIKTRRCPQCEHHVNNPNVTYFHTQEDMRGKYK